MFENELDLGVATPAIFVPEFSDEEWEHELEMCAKRAFATRQFTMGYLSYWEWEMALDEYGWDVIAARKGWENGYSYF